MKIFLRMQVWVAALLTVLALPSMNAQTPMDAQLMAKGEICLAGMYTHDTWDEYWEGTLKRSNGNIGTLTRRTAMPMVAVGLTDRFSVFAAIAYVRTSPSAGQVKGDKGLQDFSLWAKYKPLDVQAGPGSLTFHAVLGLTAPASNYLADYAPFNLGLGCTEASLRGTLQYKLNNGLYLRPTAAYHKRGNCQIERTYYYSDTGYYTDIVDIPNAVTYGGTLGVWLLDETLQIEATYDGLKTLGGHDIRRQDVGFPSNKMIFTRAGGGVRYFLPFVNGLSVMASANQVLTGRNVGQSTAITAGFTYAFQAWNRTPLTKAENKPVE